MLSACRTFSFRRKLFFFFTRMRPETRHESRKEIACPEDKYFGPLLRTLTNDICGETGQGFPLSRGSPACQRKPLS